MKYRLDLDWHEEQCVCLDKPNEGDSDDNLVEVPDDLLARREAAWKELSICERELRKLYDEHEQKQEEIRRNKEEAKWIAEWKAGEPQREADRQERKKWEELKNHFKGEIRTAQGEKGVLDSNDIALLLHGLDYNTKERNLMQSLIANAQKLEKNFAQFGATPEAIAKREERRKKREAALKEFTPILDGGVVLDA